jgi:signal transduction histidine kinase
VLFILGMAMNPQLESRRGAFLTAMLLGYGGLAAASHTVLGRLDGPLAPQIHWASTEYVMLSLASAAMVTIAIFKMGHAMSHAYERIALEVAVRREELCDESEGRTRALEGIAARLAHEVKNPLAAIKALSTHVARQAEDPKVKERLSIVAAEAERLQEIVDGFLSFSRGLDELHVSQTRPYDIARELSLLLETRAADGGISLEVRGSRELSLNGDAKKLRQALLNLVLNAMQASPRDSTVTLEVAKSCGDGAAVIRVMDRGGGMTPEVLDRIQKPYFTTREGGTGLGIAIARGIIEQHGGNLRFESTSGRGTTATVTLPACATMAAHKKGHTKLPMCREAAVPLETAKVEPVRDEGSPEPALASVTPEKVPS